MPATVMSRFSYPKVPGDSLWSIVDMSGPASYTEVSSATPPSGGQKLTAADFGLQSIDWIGAMASDDAQYSVYVAPAPFNSGSPLASALLMWIEAATGAEVAAGTDLSAHTVRLLAIGR